MVHYPSNTTKIAHNLSLATWFGGQLFGQIALNPTIDSISSEKERGRVLNEAWARFNAVNFTAIATSLLTWRLGNLRADAELRAPGAQRVKDFLLGGAAVNGIASGLLGARIAAQASGGATPVKSGLQPSSRTPQEAATAQRLIAITGPSSIALLAGAIAASALIESSTIKPRGVLSSLLSS